ncbi:cwc-15 [Symbiodinium sp. KB8]|nr:cwc-15 [Symbiodinium sp. KB8]
MTTAHRPTWNSAIGAASGTGISQGGYLTGGVSFQKSVRDIPAQLKLKERQAGQGTAEELSKRDLLAELEAEERKHFEAVRKSGKGTVPAVFAAAQGGGGTAVPAIEDAQGASSGAQETTHIAGLSAEQAALLAQFNDADLQVGEGESGLDSSDEEEDSDDEDAALDAEVKRIEAERRQRAAQEAAEAEELQRKEAAAAAMSGNPLLASGGGGSATVRRRWDDDVVFRAQAATEPAKRRRFINDTIRNDFHRAFLSRYIK